MVYSDQFHLNNGSERFVVRDNKGKFIRNFGSYPALSQLRAISRENGPPVNRIDMFEMNIKCSECGNEITDRFGRGSDGRILCQECLSETSAAVDPTKAILSESNLNHKNLCDYVINVATGCSHGCKFCYVPSTPAITSRQDMLKDEAGVSESQREWGKYVLYRDHLPERLRVALDRKRTWEHTEDGRGVVMLSSGTDCYQDRRTAQITRGCVIELVNHDKPVRILTRSPAVVRDLDVFKAADGLVTVGSSIPCLDDAQVRAIEPGAPAPSARLDALETISDAGVPVYVSMSPTYPTQDESDLRHLLQTFKQRLDLDVVFHEPINPRGANFDMTIEAAEQAGQQTLATELRKLKDRDYWVDYAVTQLETVKRLGEDLGVPVHLWPDKQLISHLEGSQKERMRKARERMSSPESYPRAPSLA